MSETAAFTGPMTRHDAILLCKMAYAQASGEALPQSALYLQAIDPNIHAYTRPRVLGLGSSYVFGSTDYLSLFCFTGTDFPLQWIGHLLGSQLTPIGPGGFAIGTYFAGNALFNWQRVQLDLPADQTKRVVFIGHSLGGALAEIMAYLALANGWTNVGLYTAASPKVGSAAWVNALVGYGGDITQLVNTGDIVPSMPPDQLLPWLDTWPWYLGPAYASFTPIAPAIRLDIYGNWWGETLPNLSNAELLGLIPTATATHASANYLKALLQQFGGPSDLIRGSNGYMQPCILIGLDQGQNGCGDPLPPGQTLPKNLVPTPVQASAALDCSPCTQQASFIQKPL